MKKKILLLFIVVAGVTLNVVAQSVSESADRIGLVGFWKMMEVSGRSEGQEYSQQMDGTNFYIFNNNGTCQYSTKAHKIANAKWTLNSKNLHVWGKDTTNDPDGIDYLFTLVMVTPQKLVVKLGDDDEYIYITFRKTNATLKSVGKSTKKHTKK